MLKLPQHLSQCLSAQQNSQLIDQDTSHPATDPVRFSAVLLQLQLMAMWIFVLMNILFRDIHQFTMSTHLEMLLTGYYNGTKVTEGLMLLGGCIVEIPILMVPLAIMLQPRYARKASIFGGILTLFIHCIELPSDLDDYFFKIVGIWATAKIVFMAYKWQVD